MRRRGQRIEQDRTPDTGLMVSMIVQHVDECAAHLERRPQRTRVITIGEYAPAARKATVHTVRKARRKPLHRPRKRPRSVHLDDEMDVIRLHGEVHEPDAEPVFRRGKNGDHEPRQGLAPETRQAITKLHGDVHRLPSLHLRSS